MENTGNMFLMIGGIAQRQDGVEWLKPFMPMLRTWADYLIDSLPSVISCPSPRGCLPHPIRFVCLLSRSSPLYWHDTKSCMLAFEPNDNEWIQVPC